MPCNQCGQQYYPFPQAGLSSGFQGPTGPQLCRADTPAVRKNFIVPPVDSPVIVETTDSSRLTVGQGVRIGDGYYLVTDIIDSMRIELRHNGLGVAVGTLVYAQHPEYGCYQFAIEKAGKVSLDSVRSLAGLDNTASGGIVGAIVSTSVNKMTYGYVGPTTIEFDMEATVELANTPVWLAFSLPVPRRITPPMPSFSAWMEDGTFTEQAVAKFGNGAYADYVIVGRGAGGLWSNGTQRRFGVSGHYEVLT